MRNSLVINSALAARLLLIIPLISQPSFAANTAEIQNDDTFLKIADEDSVPVQSIEALNPGVAADDLYIGQTINVPVVNDLVTGSLVFASGSQTASAATPTTLVTSSKPTVGSMSSPSGSSSLTVASTSAPASTSTSTTASSKSTITSSTSTSASSTSTSTNSKSTSASSTSTSTSTSSTTTPTTASTSSTTPPPTTTPSSTTIPPSTTPNSPPAAVSCAPAPVGKYHDAKDVQTKTNAFCEANKDSTSYDLEQISGGSLHAKATQDNYNGGSTPNEIGYNITVATLLNDGCFVADASIMHPLPATPDQNCTTLLYSTYQGCTANKGMGGSVTAGCFTYTFHADP